MLAERLGAVAFSEAPSDHPFLGDMYADTKRWCLLNQLTFMAKKAGELLSVDGSNAIFIQEIGLQETHDVYSKVFRERGVLSHREFTALGAMLEMFLPQVPKPAVSV